MAAGNEDIIDETMAFWEARSDSVVTPEDAQRIIDNLSEFVEILEEWSGNTDRPDGNGCVSGRAPVHTSSEAAGRG